MSKDFDIWNTKKKEINEAVPPLFYHEREIWWCSLGVNVGFEQDGTGANFDRPVLIIKGFNKHTFFGIALTGRKKSGKYYFYLGEIEDREASAILSQVKIIDTKRLIKKMQTLDEVTFKKLKESLQKILFS